MPQRIEISEAGKRDTVLGSLGFDTVIRRVQGMRSEYGPGGFGIGVVPSGSEGRQEHGGPMVEGPWGYLYGRAGVIDNYGGTAAEHAKLRERGLVIDEVADGDVLVFDHLALVVKVERDRVRLVPDDSMRLTQKQLDHYKALDASVCPYCDSPNIEADRADMDGMVAYQRVRCLVCRRTWTDGYELTRILSDDDAGRVYYFTGEVES